MKRETSTPKELEKRLHQQAIILEETQASLKKEISRRQEAENTLKQNLKQQHLLFESLMDGYALHEIILDEAGRPVDYKFLQVNSAFETLTGLRREQIIGKTVLAVLPGTEPYWIETYGEVALTGESVRFENYAQDIEGKWFEVSAFSPEKGRFVTLFRDITERKRTEAALRDSEEKYRRMVDTAEEGIWLLDADGRTQFVNNKMAEMLQYAPDEMIGRHLFDFMDEDGQAIAAGNLQRRQQGVREQHDFKFRRRDGTDMWTIISTSPIVDDDGRYLGALGMITDITDRRRVQNELESYTGRLEMLRLIEHAILEAQSPQAIADEMLSRLHEFLPFVRGSVVLIDHETDFGEVLASLSLTGTRIKAGMRCPVSDFGFRESIFAGELFYLSNLSEINNPAPVVQQLVNEGVGCIVGVPLISQGLVTGLFFLGGDQPHLFTDEHMVIARELAYSLTVAIQHARLVEQIQQQARELERRVTNRTNELLKANEQLKELDRLKSKFISDVTHELRTPVTNILLYLDLMRFGKPESNEYYQQVLHEQAERLHRLVEDSMDLSRLDLAGEDVKLLRLDLNPIVTQVVSAFAKTAETKGLALRFVPGTHIPEVPVDGGKISRMIENLLNNAITFTPAGQVAVFTLLDDTAEFAGIRVQDTGIGFTDEDRKHCFTPFYRGERVGQFNMPGSGLGLALVKRIVDLHNGRIEIESEVDQGSTVTVWLPLNQA